jgi:LPS sulfotransferase NodH
LPDPFPYVVISTQRVGSHLLAEILESHPAFAQAGEVLLPGSSIRGSLDRLSKKGRASKPHQPWTDFVRHLQTLNPGAVHVGFLLKYQHANRLADLRAARADTEMFEDMKVIHLTRRNILRAVISQYLALKRGVHVTRKTTDYQVNSVAPNPESVVSLIHQKSSKIREFRELLASHPATTEILYEDLIEHQRVSHATVERLCSFFGVDDRFARQPQTVKLTPPRLAAVVENYDQLADRLRGTKLENMLE